MLETHETIVRRHARELSGERPVDADALGPDQGVIEEARRRQRRRRLGYALAGSLVALAIAALAWALGGGTSGASPVGRAQYTGTGLLDSSDAYATPFEIRLVPTLAVAQPGWCVVLEEHGAVAGGGACGSVPPASSPFLQVYGWGEVGHGHQTKVAVTAPRVASVLFDGKVHVTPVAVPGLPYGLRAVRIVSRVRSHASHSTLVALDARGRPIPENWSQPARQGAVRSWRYPASQPRGVCRLRVAGVPGLLARGGQVATVIRPFPGTLLGEALVSCIDAEYRLNGIPIDAEILLDAAHPAAPAGMLPDWRPVAGAPGYLANGGLTARRVAGAWLLVRQGSGLAERMRLLRHLTATVAL